MVRQFYRRQRPRLITLHIQAYNAELAKCSMLSMWALALKKKLVNVLVSLTKSMVPPLTYRPP